MQFFPVLELSRHWHRTCRSFRYFLSLIRHKGDSTPSQAGFQRHLFITKHAHIGCQGSKKIQIDQRLFEALGGGGRRGIAAAPEPLEDPAAEDPSRLSPVAVLLARPGIEIEKV